MKSTDEQYDNNIFAKDINNNFLSLPCSMVLYHKNSTRSKRKCVLIISKITCQTPVKPGLSSFPIMYCIVLIWFQVPLISGSALKMEGQLTIYNYRAEKNDNEKVTYMYTSFM